MMKRKILIFTIVAVVLMVVALILESSEIFGGIDNRCIINITEFIYGIATGSMILNILYLSGMMEKVHCWKRKLIKK